jgi:UDP-glucose 4-epimerase
MKRILITGIAGMLGSELLDIILSESKKNLTIGIDNLKLGKISFIKNNLNNKKFRFFNLDLSKTLLSNKLKKLLKKNKYLNEVWLLAANSDIQKGIKDYKEDYKNTFLTTLNTLVFLRPFLNNKSKIVFASSSAVFGNYKSEISENSPTLRQCSNYGAMKLASEAFISSFSYKNNLRAFIFRFPNVVGSNLTHGIVHDFFKKFSNNKKKYVQVLGDGSQKKPYAYSEEIIKCIRFFIKNNSKQFVNYYNIGPTDLGITVKNIVKIFSKLYPDKIIKYQKKNYGWLGDIPKYNFNTTAINQKGFYFKLNSFEAINLSITNNIHKFHK